MGISIIDNDKCQCNQTDLQIDHNELYYRKSNQEYMGDLYS